MTNKIWDGSAWKEYKNLRIWNGSAWKDAFKGWAWDGSSWKQWYPEYPVNTSSPTISGSSIQGNQLTVTDGSWRGFPSDKAFSYTSTAYQWLRNGSDISGATGNQYATVVADVGNAISCRVTVSNSRGPTPSTSSNSVIIQSALPSAPTGLALSQATDTPGAPASISVSNISTTSYNVSWGVASGTFQAYEVLTSNNLHVVSNLNQSTRTATVSGGSSGESFYVAAFATNINGKIGISWNAASGATSYDVYVGGVYRGNTTSTSYTHTTGSIGSFSVNVRSRNAAGAESTGVSGSITLDKRYSVAQGYSGNFYALYPSFTSGPSASSVTSNSATISWSSSNQSSYTVTGVGSFSGSTGTSVNLSGLNASTTYYPYVTITSSTGQSTSAYATFTTSSAPVVPVINSAYITTSDTAQTLMTLNWSATNQSSWSISVSPSTSQGSSFSGISQTDRYIGAGAKGTTYTITLTITSVTGHQTSQTVYHTPPAASAAPSAPTNVNVTGGGYVTWTAPSGATSYTVEYYAANSSSGSNVSGPYYANVGNQTFYQINYPLVNNILLNWVRARVTAANSGGQVSQPSAWYPSETTYVQDKL